MTSEVPEVVGPQVADESLQSIAVTELPEDSVAPEALPYKISFQDYKEGECQIDGMGKPSAAVALKVVRDIGMSYPTESHLMSCCKHIDEIKPVVNKGDYSVLYKGLGYDIEVREIKCKREDKRRPDRAYDFRLFFYALDIEKTFYIIAIRKDHYDTTKGHH